MNAMRSFRPHVEALEERLPLSRMSALAPPHRGVSDVSRGLARLKSQHRRNSQHRRTRGLGVQPGRVEDHDAVRRGGHDPGRAQVT